MRSAVLVPVILSTKQRYLLEDPFMGGAVDLSKWTKTDSYTTVQRVTNGTFAANITGWTDASDAGGSIAWNASEWMDVISNGVGTARARATALVTIANYPYRLTWSQSSGIQVTYKIGTSAGGDEIATGTFTGSGTKTVNFTATGAATHLEFSHVTNDTLSIDTVSVLATQGLITVGSGLLNFVGGLPSPVIGDPAAVSKQSWARQAGLTLEWQVTPAATTTYFLAGFTDGSLVSTGYEAHDFYFATGGAIYVSTPTGITLTPAIYTAASTWIRIEALAVGALFSTSTDNRVTWSYIWLNTSVTTTPLYAFIESYDAALTSSDVYVSQRSITPAAYSATPAAPPLALGDELATGNLVVGLWYEITATEANHFFTGCAIGNRFRATATTALDANNKVKNLVFTTSSLLTYVGDAGKHNGIYQVSPTITDTYHAGIVCHANSATAPTYGIFAYYDKTAGKASMAKLVNSVWTDMVAPTTAAYSAGAVLEIISNGTKHGLYYNKVLIGTVQTLDVSANYGTHVLSMQTLAADSCGATLVQV